MNLPQTQIAWNCVNEKIFLDFPYMQLVERLCKPVKAPDSLEPHRFYVFRSRDWCNIIPVTEDGKVVMIRQFRAGTMGIAYEFPGGVVESDDTNVQASAIREMIEETGYEPLTNAKCTLMGTSHPNPALQDNKLHSLIVGPVKKSRAQNLDPAEDIEVIEVAIQDLPQFIKNAPVNHALMLTTVYQLLMQNKDTEALMKNELLKYSK